MPQISSTSDFKAYKYKDLRVYSSTEWLTDNRKRYRQVFEKSDVKYIYADLALINKMYDREDWHISVELICYKIQRNRQEICKLQIDKTVSKADHIINIREGWGNKRAGTFWKKGKYIWEAYIDGERVGTKTFYVEDIARTTSLEVAQTIKVTDLKYYESNYDQTTDEDEKVYMQSFDSDETRYVFLDLTLANWAQEKERHIEVFFKIYNAAREVKGAVSRVEHVKKRQEIIHINAGWGANVKGSWRRGRYDVEVIYHDRMIAQSHFSVGGSFVEGALPPEIPEGLFDFDTAVHTGSKESYHRLNKLIGLQPIKKQIQDHTSYIKFLQLRREKGYTEERSIKVHSVFKGNPGTGKTTVARLLGAIYHDIGVLSSGHVHEVGRVDLVGEYIGQTAPKVKDAIEKAAGGVLFIDEAYSLARSGSDAKDFGREAIEILIKEMSQPNCSFMVVVAGYPSEMDTFVESNPGLASRFRYYYDFPDYSLTELQEIAEYICDQTDLRLSDQARAEFYRILQEDYRNRDKSFGNARYVEQQLEKAKINMGIRIMSGSPGEIKAADLSTVMLSDILRLRGSRSTTPADPVIDEQALVAAMDKLHALIGLSTVKERIENLVNIVRYRIEKGLPITEYVKMHTVLTGNPGTGKTTVTRICSEIFKALGVLSRGHIIETDRQGLVAGYVGQTAIKTTEVIESAIGGVLFIDEAYGLLKAGAHNDFGDEAIQILIKQMEDRRGEFFVFAAGYPKEMDAFLKINPGLRSRFDVFLHFEDYTVDELVQIADAFFSDGGYRMSSTASEAIRTHLEKEYEAKNEQWGNARRVRAYTEAIIQAQNVRVASEQHYDSPHYDALIKETDVNTGAQTIQDQGRYRRPTVGF